MNLKRTLSSIGVLIACAVVYVFTTGCPLPNPTPTSWTNVNIVTLDFQPVGTSNYNTTCVGAKLSYSNVKHYTPTIVLAAPVPARAQLEFWIMEDKFWSDHTLGWFSVVFLAGSTTPDSVRTFNNPTGGDTWRKPEGAPDVTNGSFWIGCTKLCRTKSNGYKGDDSHASIYLRKFSILSSPAHNIGGTNRSPNRNVYCK